MPVLMPIVVGAPRSGTTLLRLMLDAHPELVIPPETGFLSLTETWKQVSPRSAAEFVEAISHYPPDAPTWPDFGIDRQELTEILERQGPFHLANAVRVFYRIYAGRFGKSRYGDKTPEYCFHLPSIHALLPEAGFVHIVRDGRAVASSWRRTWFSPGPSMTRLAHGWIQHVEAVRSAAASRAVPVLEIAYEALVTTPTAVLRSVCEWVALSFSTRMLDYHRTASIRLAEHRDRRRVDGSLVATHAQRLELQARVSAPPDPARIDSWVDEMSTAERDEFESVAGLMLEAYGYRLGTP